MATNRDRLEATTGRASYGNLDKFIVSWRKIVIRSATENAIRRQVNISYRITHIEYNPATSNIFIFWQSAVRNTIYNAYIGIWHIAKYFELFVG